MGEFIGSAGIGPGEEKAREDMDVKMDVGKVETDVEDVFADGIKLELPVFNVTSKEFHQNMTDGRRRLRFNSGSSVQNYMQKTRYNRPFWISWNDGKNTYVRKVK